MESHNGAWDIEAVLAHYGATVEDHHTLWQSLRCPFHDDQRASASVSVDLGAFTCFACDVKGDAIKVIRTVEDCDYASATRLYEKITGDKVSQLSTAVSRKRFSGFDLLGKPRFDDNHSGGVSDWIRQETN